MPAPAQQDGTASFVHYSAEASAADDAGVLFQVHAVSFAQAWSTSGAGLVAWPTPGRASLQDLLLRYFSLCRHFLGLASKVCTGSNLVSMLATSNLLEVCGDWGSTSTRGCGSNACCRSGGLPE